MYTAHFQGEDDVVEEAVHSRMHLTSTFSFAFVVAVAMSPSYSQAMVLFEETFESNSREWALDYKHTESGSFDPSFETSEAHSGSKVGRIIGSAEAGDHWNSRGVSARTIDLNLEMASPVMYYSFWMKVPKESGEGRFGVGLSRWDPYHEYWFPRGVLYSFESYCAEINRVGWEWYGYGDGRLQQEALANVRDGWVHVEGAQVAVKHKGTEHNTAARISINGWLEDHGKSSANVDEVEFGELTIAIGTEEGGLGWDEAEVWIDDLIVRDDFIAPEQGTVGKATIIPHDQGHQLLLEGVTWPMTSGSGFGLKLELYVGDVEPRQWAFGYDSAPHPDTVWLHPTPPLFYDPCDYDLSKVAVAWAHMHKDEGGDWEGLPAFASEQLFVEVDSSSCK